MSNRDDRRWAARWLGAPVERLSSERRRELIEAAAARADCWARREASERAVRSS
jgi:hypothetical protein